MLPRWWVLPFLVLGALAACAPGCAAVRPKLGDTCNPGDAICQPAGQALVCQAGHYVMTRCGGPQSCSMLGDRTVMCDQSTNAMPGDVCTAHIEGQSQCSSSDRTSYLTCKGGIFTSGKCPGAGVCGVTAGLVVCN